MSNVFWWIYIVGGMVNIIGFYSFRSFVEKELRCMQLAYIPVAGLSFAFTLFALVFFLMGAIEERRQK